MTCYVYIIVGKEAPLKVGVSHNPNLRRASLQAQEGRSLSVFRTWPLCDFRSARAIEAEAHKLLASNRVRGEWFSVTTDEAVAAVEAGLYPERGKLQIAQDVTIPPATLVHGFQHKAGLIGFGTLTERAVQRQWLLACGVHQWDIFGERACNGSAVIRDTRDGDAVFALSLDVLGDLHQAELFCRAIRHNGGKVIFQSGPECF